MTEKKFILNFTPTGLIPTKEQTSQVPISPNEIAEQILEAAQLGANMAHIHARESDGTPAYSKNLYADIISRIRKYDKEIILCVSTSGRSFFEFEKRSEVLDLDCDLKPDFGSLTLSSLNFNKDVSVNSPETIKRLAEKMLEKKIKPELEAFDLGMINYAKYLIKKGLIKSPYYFNLILGNIACAQADMLSLGLMIRDLPEGSIWSVGGVGNSQLQMNAMAIIAGGGVRIGLEDNIWFDQERTKLASNIELIKRILTIADAMGRKPYNCSEARILLGCSKTQAKNIHNSNLQISALK